MGVAPIHCTPNRLARSQYFFAYFRHVTSHTPWPHDASYVDDLVEWNIAGVFDVLHLLSVTWWLLQGFDDKGARRGYDRHLGLSILDGQPKTVQKMEKKNKMEWVPSM